ncbi:hypothetical protein [Candidatus Endoriftia persephonae]|jgi:hypothetical protein|nr:hypothetical protein [Candidatus Endoriftia persephone]USF88728.1 hypothetical protein L0Y14_05715 [Candidatus Endoriftia persephone]
MRINSGANGLSLAGLQPEVALAAMAVGIYFMENSWRCELKAAPGGFAISIHPIFAMFHDLITEQIDDRLGDEFAVKLDQGYWHVTFQPGTA